MSTKKLLVMVGLLCLTITACAKQQTITVSNPSAIHRTEEVVEVQWSALRGFKPEAVTVTENGKQLPVQMIYNGETTPQALLFPVTIAKYETKKYKIQTGKPQTFPARTFGRKVPERKDDFAWENDKVVYRVYGPALAPEYPSNGYDMWLKNTNQLIVNKFYKDDLENHKPYHINYGEGLDCYKVGHTLGAGAIAPFLHDTIWVENNYTTVKVLDSGILRTSFELTYDSVQVGNRFLNEKLVITLDAGSNFNKAQVEYSGDFHEIELAAGIFLHDKIGVITQDPQNSWIAYAENAVSDAGVPEGRSYVGVVFSTPVKQYYQNKKHVAGVLPYAQGAKLTYYFGGGWSQAGFASDEDWTKCVENQAALIVAPLKIRLF
ncbi:DUF4861 domain-containing protein [Bacteroidia bacterium]|nr:DUF4861 domain-containing protein [Bacteroidia bacterium]